MLVAKLSMPRKSGSAAAGRTGLCCRSRLYRGHCHGVGRYAWWGVIRSGSGVLQHGASAQTPACIAATANAVSALSAGF